MGKVIPFKKRLTKCACGWPVPVSLKVTLPESETRVVPLIEVSFKCPLCGGPFTVNFRTS